MSHPSADESDCWQRRHGDPEPVQRRFEFQFHDDDSADEHGKIGQLLHHVCDRPPLCGISDLDHFHVVRARQDEAGCVRAAGISARLKGVREPRSASQTSSRLRQIDPVIEIQIDERRRVGWPIRQSGPHKQWRGHGQGSVGWIPWAFPRSKWTEVGDDGDLGGTAGRPLGLARHYNQISQYLS